MGEEKPLGTQTFWLALFHTSQQEAEWVYYGREEDEEGRKELPSSPRVVLASNFHH